MPNTLQIGINLRIFYKLLIESHRMIKKMKVLAMIDENFMDEGEIDNFFFKCNLSEVYNHLAWKKKELYRMTYLAHRYPV